MSSRSTAPSYHPGPSRPSDAGSTAASRFDPARFFHLGNDDHFYRPVIETYVYLGSRAFGCDARDCHLVSIGILLLVLGAVYLFGRTLTTSRAVAAVSAVCVAVLSGFADAVAWIGAITDQWPALWYVLTLWLFPLYLRGRGRWCDLLVLLERRVRWRVAPAVTLAVVPGLSARFGTFATKGAARCAERTEPYRAFVEEIGRTNPAPKPFDTVGVSAATARPIPELYRDVAAQAAFCMDTLRVTIR